MAYGQFAAQTKDFSITWDATPSKVSQDVVMGLSNGAAKAFTDMACLVRFANSGNIDVRNGAKYDASSVVPYKAGAVYFFRMSVRMSTNTYDVFVKPPDGPQVVLASNFAFRAEQAKITQLNYLNKMAVVGDANCVNMSSPQPMIGPPTTDVPPVVVPPDPIPPDPQPSGGFPDASNTGVPPGTVLTPSGNVTVSTAGQVVDALDITGTVSISASDVTIQNCYIHTTDIGVTGMIQLFGNTTGVVIKNCKIVGPGYFTSGGGGGAFGVITRGTNGFTVDHCDISQVEHGVHIEPGGHATVVKDCYIHDLYSISNSHYDCVGYWGGGQSDFSLLIDHCTLIQNQSANLASHNQTFRGDVFNVTIQNSQLQSWGWYTLGYSNGTPNAGVHRNCAVINNKIQWGMHAGAQGSKYYLYPAFVPETWTGNYDYTTGAAIPRP